MTPGRFSTKPGTHQTFEPPKLSAKSTKTFSFEEKEHAKKEGKEEWGESATEIGN